MKLSEFKGSLWFTFFALLFSGAVGYAYEGISHIHSFLISTAVLGIIELSVSIDNAVVNASILKKMDEVWQKRFLTWGMLIAVFGMRFVIPLAIVSIAGHVNIIDAFSIALFDHKKYQELISSVHIDIMAFGGAFLALVFSSHFINKNKEMHWIPIIEPFLSKLGKHENARHVFPLVLILIFYKLLGDQQGVDFIIPALWGVVTYLVVDGFKNVFEVDNLDTAVAKSGAAGFAYLEVLDASFSFDGVIAAFAVSNNFLIIMSGLSIGAFFVRSITIHLVKHDSLSHFKYLEAGAFWGIGWLVLTMFLSTMHIELGELIVAGVSASVIIIAVIHSVISKRTQAAKH